MTRRAPRIYTAPHAPNRHVGVGVADPLGLVGPTPCEVYVKCNLENDARSSRFGAYGAVGGGLLGLAIAGTGGLFGAALAGYYLAKMAADVTQPVCPGLDGGRT